MDAASGIRELCTSFGDNVDDAPTLVKTVVGIDIGTVVAMNSEAAALVKGNVQHRAR